MKEALPSVCCNPTSLLTLEIAVCLHRYAVTAILIETIEMDGRPNAEEQGNDRGRGCRK